MAVVHATDTRDAFADFIASQLADGWIELWTAADVMIADGLDFDATTPFAPSSGGVIVANAIDPDTGVSGTGVVTKAVFFTTGGDEVLRCSVTATGGGGDIELSSVSLTAGQSVSISSLTYAAAP
jgi:hypothetical protein